jgi:hypothetical protein
MRKAVWRKPSFLELSTDARLLYLWSWTNPAANLIGLYRAGVSELVAAVGPANGRPGLERLEDALRELSRKPLLLYDDDAALLWVVGRVEHVLTSPKVRIAMRRQFAEVPPGILRDRFVALYGSLLDLEEALVHAGHASQSR